MNKAIRHQDAAGGAGAPLGVFHDGQLVQFVPASDPLGYETRAAAAAHLNVDKAALEVLLACPEHPDTPAVDCLICVPVED